MLLHILFFMLHAIPPIITPLYASDIKDVFKDYKILSQAFSYKIKNYFNVKHCFLFSSGRAALSTILSALKTINNSRNKVIIPAFTCYSVAASVIKAGLSIRLCDIDRNSLDFDYNMLFEILSKEGSEILAIIPVHLFGLRSNIELIKEYICNYPEIYIIEDAAQCMGLKVKGKLLGTSGDVGIFSLGRGKSISSIGGGVVITNNDKISFHIKSIFKEIPYQKPIKNAYYLFYGILLLIFSRPFLYWFPSSIPFLKIGETIYDPCFKIERISSCQIAFALSWQEKLKIVRKKRLVLTRFWASFFRNKPFYSFILPEEIIELIRFPLRIDNLKIRNLILKEAKDKGLGIEKSYPDSIDNIKELRHLFDKRNFADAKYIAQHLITLPVHSFVSEKDIKAICEIFCKFS